MTGSQQQQQGDGPADWRGWGNALRFFARAAALPVEVFARRFGTWGEKYLGPEAAAGLLWPFVFMSLYGPDPDLGAVTLFWAAMVGLLVAHRAAGLSLRRKGYECHSRFVGESWFDRLPGGGDPARAHGLEVLAALVAAAAAFQAASKPLGGLLLVGALAHAVNLSAAHQSADARLRAMRDAAFESAYYAGRFRGGPGGRR